MLCRRLLSCAAVAGAALLLVLIPAPEAAAYVEAPHSFGQVVQLSSNIVVMQVEKVDKEKNMIIYRKLEDLKGKHPTDVIKHNIGRGGFNWREWQYPMEWAEVGKKAVFFHNGTASETCTGTYWYQTYPGGEWWNLSHGEPFLLRSYAGDVNKLITAVKDVLANKEVVVSCMVDGNKDDLHLRRAKMQRLKVSLKLQNYDPKRDFVGWGGEDYHRLQGMAGFTHHAPLACVGPEAQAVSCVDIDGDGKPDLCLVGAGKVALLQNGGESLNEVSLPGLVGGSRAAVWADYNGDGLPDLLLATANGPKLYTNLGKGQFRDDSHLLPKEQGYNLTRGRLDRLRWRWSSRYSAGQRFLRSAFVSQQGQGRRGASAEAKSTARRDGCPALVRGRFDICRSRTRWHWRERQGRHPDRLRCGRRWPAGFPLWRRQWPAHS